MKIFKVFMIVFVLIQTALFAGNSPANATQIVNGKPMDFSTSTTVTWYAFTLGKDSNIALFGSELGGSFIFLVDIYDENMENVFHECCVRATSIDLSAGKYFINIENDNTGKFSVYSQHITNPVDPNPPIGSILNPHLPVSGVPMPYGVLTATNVYSFETLTSGKLSISGTPYGIHKVYIYNESMERVYSGSNVDSVSIDINAGKYYLVASAIFDDKVFITISSFVLKPIPLATPTNITASDGTSKYYVAIGNYSVNYATSYDIARATSSAGKKTFLVRTSATSYKDTTAIAGKKYYYFVKAINSKGASGYSAYNVGMRAYAVSTPTNITASDTFKSNITIGNYSVYGATYYDIARATSSDGHKTYLVRTSATSYADKTAVPGTKYFYFVKALSSKGGSSYSEYNVGMRATAISAPKNITASDGNWVSNVSIGSYGVSGATHYKIYRAKSSGGYESYLGLTYGVGYADTTAAPGKMYYYFVKACNDKGCSKYSDYDTGWRQP